MVYCYSDLSVLFQAFPRFLGADFGVFQSNWVEIPPSYVELVIPDSSKSLR